MRQPVFVQECRPHALRNVSLTWLVVRLASLAAVLMPSASASPAHADPSAPAEALPASALTDFVIHGLDRPVRVRLVCLTEGTSRKELFDDIRARYLRALFTQLDNDGDGKLTPAEAMRLPAPRLPGTTAGSADVHVAFNFRVLDTDGDGAATPAELESYLNEFGEPLLRFHTVPGESGVDSLFRALDVDGDQVLTAAEARQFERLLQRDRDANRVLTLDELRGRVGQQLPPEFVATARDATPKGPLRIVSESPSGALVDVEIRVEFSEAPSGQLAPLPKVAISLAETAKALGLSVEKSPHNELVMRSGRRRLVVRVLPPMANTWNADRTTLEQEFAGLAEASSGSVSLNATMSSGLKAMLPLADRNGDERVDATEFQGCLARVGAAQSAVAATRLRAVAFGEQSGLLPWADRNRDGRLSRRELAMIPDLFQSFATDEEGKGRQLKAADLPMTTLLVLERGPFRDSAERDVLRNAGPVWFSRADRNGDGDLDRDEFLGAAEDFDRLDANHDGWIDLEEALRADVPAPQNPKTGAPQ